MILVDSNIFMYAAGDQNPNKGPSVAWLERVARAERRQASLVHENERRVDAPADELQALRMGVAGAGHADTSRGQMLKKATTAAADAEQPALGEIGPQAAVAEPLVGAGDDVG